MANVNAEFASLLKLGRAERLQLVADLWDSIAQEDTSDLSVPDWKYEELCRRREYLRHHPETAVSWEEVKRHARERSSRLHD